MQHLLAFASFGWFLGCHKPDTVAVGGFVLAPDDGGLLDIRGPHGAHLDAISLLTGQGSVDPAEIEMSFGAFRAPVDAPTLAAAATYRRADDRPADDRPAGDAQAFDVLDADDAVLGTLAAALAGPDGLVLTFTPADPHDRVGLSAACDGDGDGDHFLGLGSHAMDVDHVGEAFGVWTSEPGIGKTDSDDEAPGWPIEGSKHATSFPSPFLLRPHHPDGLLVDTGARLDVDLCSADPDRFSLVAWDEGELVLRWSTGHTPLDVVRRATEDTGRLTLPPPWVFGAWGDAIRGSARVRTVRDELRANHVPATVVWSEDWKGASDTPTGYRLGEEWFVDRALYPDVEDVARELDEAGLRWLAYFAPFVAEGTATWDDAEAAGAIVSRADGTPYTFAGVTLKPTGLIDVSTEVGRDWAAGKLRDALALGFDGWMADYGEWLPADAVLADGSTGLEAHNRYPEQWQQIHAEVAAEDGDATFFVRSGWIRTPGLVPVVWGGDQRTSFDPDDGLPTVVPLGLGLSVSGVAVFTHDVAGYQSVGNPPSTKELWFRWASLGAYSPILRVHHGSFDTDNWQFDTDADTLAHYAATATESVRLFPYRYGLAAEAAADGTPMVLPEAFVTGDADWGRTDVWMLGQALLVAPVVEAGVDGRDVQLPPGDWWAWTTRAPASSGWAAAPLGAIPVFARGGTTVPTLASVPDTLVDDLPAGSSLTTLADVDGERIVYLFGDGGPFREADGTTYTPRGAATGAAEVTATFDAGEVEVGGLTVAVSGPKARAYTFVVAPPHP